MLKPRACLATLAKSGARPTLARYLRDAEPGLQVVAPLDFPAEGVVLLTSDGELAQAMGKRGKRADDLPPQAAGPRRRRRDHAARAGLALGGARGQAGDDRSAGDDRTNSWIEMVVPESRPRALKAGGDLIRHTVLKISRIRLGGLSFEGLAMGGWRDMTKGEVSDLRKRAGLA